MTWDGFDDALSLYSDPDALMASRPGAQPSLAICQTFPKDVMEGIAAKFAEGVSEKSGVVQATIFLLTFSQIGE